MVNNEMNWNFTNAAINAQKTAAKKAENNARAETVRRSAAQAAEARAKKAKEAAEAKAKKAREAANKANNQARQAAVERSKAAAAAERAARAAARGETSNRRNKTNAANRAAKKAAENAEKAQANAEKAAANAKKAQLNVLIENARTQWLNVIASNKMNKNAKKKRGTSIFRKASLKLHPNRHRGEEDLATESFKRLGSLHNEFQNYINQN
jgi:hypothetical protein